MNRVEEVGEAGKGLYSPRALSWEGAMTVHSSSYILATSSFTLSLRFYLSLKPFLLGECPFLRCNKRWRESHHNSEAKCRQRSRSTSPNQDLSPTKLFYHVANVLFMLVSPMALFAVCFLEQPIPIPHKPRLQGHIYNILRRREQHGRSGGISDMLRRTVPCRFCFI